MAEAIMFPITKEVLVQMPMVFLGSVLAIVQASKTCLQKQQLLPRRLAEVNSMVVHP